jgi:hypothetical protein
VNSVGGDNPPSPTARLSLVPGSPESEEGRVPPRRRQAAGGPYAGGIQAPVSRSQTARHPGGPPSPRVPGPSLTPASAASDQLWLLLRISSTDQGRSHTGSEAGARSWSGFVRFIYSGKDKKKS